MSTPEIPKTPLQNSWTLWYDNPRLQKPNETWLDNLKNCSTFSTVEDFWSVYNNVKPAGSMGCNSNYHLFKEGIMPMWEDKSNKEGGKWIITIPKQDSKKGKVDEWWLYTTLAMIGETMDSSGLEVCGAVVSIRKSQDRLALWIRGSEEKVSVAIGQRWKVALEVSDRTVLKFQTHKDATKNNSSFKNKDLYEC
ncbi:hypothetical protein TrVE_jg1554 [Triparma verrucosa]|uniref:mRNA cap-binding protein n=2 Tax=Triparma TaxID=722752 RepID=A0A9W7EFS6_9STRA|nr:hypothetical protein TrST_g8485 [Triparma strigata]GMI14664.1 hypothetical protein TrVE_jg1554 [Triparma verrucosa]|mmetsp:Transcript_21722/g.40889  ORF Transcript_21722/g.40889 Transcript_21722/m.40889 type:complete len:194 (-) Transcript_21722:31-612(-)